MRRVLICAVLCLGASLNVRAQITVVNKARAATNNGSATWSVAITPVTGDTLVVGCDYTPGPQFAGVTDNAGDKFVQVGGGAASQNFAAQAYLATGVKGGTTTVTCAATGGPQYNEIYVTELKGVDPVHPVDTQVSVSGPGSPAKASLATSHGSELVWAYAQSGHVTNGSGWTALSTFDGNLVAGRTPTTAGTVSGSFAVTADWTLILAALNPAGANSGSSGSSNPISVAVSPSSASVQVSQSASFSATVQNDAQNKGVTWNLTGSGCSGTSCGTLSNATSTSVTFTAPGAVPTPASVTLTATSAADTTKSSAASITVTSAPQPISVSVSPSSSSVQTSQAANFTATVQNDSQNKGVTWSLAGSGCSGASCGTLSNVTATSVSYTAPGTAPSPATVTLKATSAADTTKSSAASITVTSAPQPISVSVNPSSSSVQTSQAANFTATVQNDSQNKGVTWSLAGSGCSGASCGTLSNVTATSVSYTAPGTVPSPATVTLKGTSAADTTKSASAAITVTGASDPPGGSPVLVQHVSHSNTQTNFVNAYQVRFVFPAGAGNCVAVGVQSSGGSVPTVTDDVGNAYTQVITALDSTNTNITLFKAPMTHAGAQNLQVGFSTAAEFVAAEASEFMNVDSGCALDGASTNAGVGAQLTAGNITTSANGDLIYAYGVQDTTPDPIQSWQAGAGFTLLGADVMDSHFTEWEVQGTAGTINPTATLAPANNWFMAGMAIKGGSSGTAPNGIHGVHAEHLALVAGQKYPLTVQFPCTTTSGPIVVIGNAEPPNDFTGLADGNGNHWTKRGAASFNYSGLADIWDTDAGPTTCSPSMTVTINKSGTDITGSTLIFIDVSNCGAQPCFDSAPGYVGAGGDQTSGSTLTGASITPTTATGACFASLAVDANSIMGVSPGLFLASTANPEPRDFEDDENNGYAVIYNPGTAGFTLTWQEYGGSAQGWANGITCYKGPGN